MGDGCSTMVIGNQISIPFFSQLADDGRAYKSGAASDEYLRVLIHWEVPYFYSHLWFTLKPPFIR